MKIAIYAIAKNEEQFVDRFMDSVNDADKVVVCDTGSNDKTKELLEKRGAEVHDIQVMPFRFDLARNMALEFVKDCDIAIALDLDEVMVDGWRDKVEKAWKKGTTLLRYKMVYDWQDKEQTIPGLVVWGVKIHCPNTYVWIDPIHENIKPVNKEKEALINEHLIVHHPDPSREERNTRIEIMKKWVEDEPDNERASYVLGREFYNTNQTKEAKKELKRFLQLSKAYDGFSEYTRSSACRMIAQSIMTEKGDPNEMMTWFLRGLGEFPAQRENWMWTAYGWLLCRDYDQAYATCQRGLKITDDKPSVVKESRCWGKYAEELFDIIKKKRDE